MKTVLFLGFILFTSCASRHETKSQVQGERKQVEAIVDLDAQGERLKTIISNDNSLKNSQKQKFKDLLDEYYDHLKQQQAKLSQLKVVLMHELLSKKVNHRKIQVTKFEIEKAYKNKMKKFYQVLEKSRKILGEDCTSHEKLVREMIISGDT